MEREEKFQETRKDPILLLEINEGKKEKSLADGPRLTHKSRS